MSLPAEPLTVRRYLVALMQAGRRTATIQRRLAALAERGDPDAFAQIRAEVLGEPAQLAAGSVEGRPRLTEPWFC